MSVNGRTTMRPGGFVLPLVLFVVALVTVTGLAFVAGHALDVGRAENLRDRARAVHLAESGVELAMYYLRYPPESLAPGYACPSLSGPIPAGTGGDTISVEITPRDSLHHPWTDRFTIRATGRAVNADREIRGCHTVTAEVVAGQRYFHFGRALLTDQGAELPRGLEIHGDLHANGRIMSWARCRGAVSAQRWVWFDDWRGITSVREWTDAARLPAIEPGDYEQYRIDGTTYDAIRWSSRRIDRRDWIVRGGAVRPDNPGGVVVATHRDRELRLEQDLDFTGTLVVDGDLWIWERGVKITAVEKFPALVVRGNVIVRHQADATIEGVVICGGEIRGEWIGADTALRITGAVISGKGGFSLLTLWNRSHRVDYDASRARIYDVTISYQGVPEKLTIARWQG